MRWTRAIRIDIGLSIAAILMVSAPMLLTHSGFAWDFTNSLWLSWVAGKSLLQAGHPGFFLNTATLGVFYPLFAFYGGPLFAVTGAISDLLGGHAVIAFIAVTVLAIAGAYGGMLWLARELGVRGIAAHAPALTVITSAYYITNLYGRGAWTELMVTSAIAPLLASGLHLLRAETWRPVPIAIFVIAVALFTAGHNITLVWGATIAVVALLILWLALGRPRHLPYRRLSMLGGLGVAAMLMNAWFLLPDIAFAGKVAAAHAVHASATWETTREFNLPAVLLNPLREVPSESTTPALYVQVPDWFMLWGIAAGALLLWRGTTASVLRRVWLGAILMLLGLLGMMMLKPVWQFIGYPFDEIQFPYRLGTYVFYTVAALVLIGALALQRAATSGGSPRIVKPLRIALVAVSTMSVALCLWQEWAPNTQYRLSYANRADALASATVLPKSWYAGGDYDEWQAKVVPVPANRMLSIDPSAVRGDRFSAVMSVPPGPEPIQTNISGGPYLVHIGGLRLVGRSTTDTAVVKRVNGGSGPVRVVIETTHGAVIELGRVVSLLALLAVLAVVASAAVRARGHQPQKRSRRPSPRSSVSR